MFDPSMTTDTQKWVVEQFGESGDYAEGVRSAARAALNPSPGKQESAFKVNASTAFICALAGGIDPAKVKNLFVAIAKRGHVANLLSAAEVEELLDEEIERARKPDAIEQPASAKANGHPYAAVADLDDGPWVDDAPPVVSLGEFGLPAEGTAEIEPVAQASVIAPVKVEATPWTWRDARDIPTRQFLYGRHLVRGFVSATAAPGGLGKSSLTRTEAIAMTCGRRLLGKWQPSHPLRVWCWNLEDPQEEIDRGIAAACLHHGITAEDLGGRLHVNSGREQPCVVARMEGQRAIIVAPIVEAIIAEIQRLQIDVVIIDPYVSCHEVAENDNGAQDMIVKRAWGQVAHRGNCAVSLVHHTRKLGDGEVTADAARGGSATVDGCRDVRVLNRMTKAEGDKWGVENHRLFFRVFSDKANLSPPAEKSDWYQLVSIDLRNGGDGPSDQVQAITTWQPPDAFDGVSVADLLSVQKQIAEGEWRQDSQSENWAGYAVAEVLRLDLKRPAAGEKPKRVADLEPAEVTDRAKISSLLKSWIESGALKIAERKDAQRKDRKCVEVGQWAT